MDRATPVLQRAYDYWNRLRGDRDMPGRADIDPINMTGFLSHVMLIDVLHDSRPGWPLDFRYRLVGTTAETHMSRRFTGVCMSNIAHQQPESQLWKKLARAVRDREPQLDEVPYVGPHRDFLTVVDLVLPLSADGIVVNMLMPVVDFVPKQR